MKSSPRSLGAISVFSRSSDVWIVPVADQTADQRAPLAPRVRVLSLAGRRIPATVIAAVLASTVRASVQLDPSGLTLMRQLVSPIRPISARPDQLD